MIYSQSGQINPSLTGRQANSLASTGKVQIGYQTMGPIHSQSALTNTTPESGAHPLTGSALKNITPWGLSTHKNSGLRVTRLWGPATHWNSALTQERLGFFTAYRQQTCLATAKNEHCFIISYLHVIFLKFQKHHHFKPKYFGKVISKCINVHYSSLYQM